jgi:hypothetical protein
VLIAVAALASVSVTHVVLPRRARHEDTGIILCNIIHAARTCLLL